MLNKVFEFSVNDSDVGHRLQIIIQKVRNKFLGYSTFIANYKKVEIWILKNSLLYDILKMLVLKAKTHNNQ